MFSDRVSELVAAVTVDVDAGTVVLSLLTRAACALSQAWLVSCFQSPKRDWGWLTCLALNSPFGAVLLWHVFC
jgi:hypothetical protein